MDCSRHAAGTEEFTGKVAIVTGVAPGLGRSLALAVSGGCLGVALVDVDEEHLQET